MKKKIRIAIYSRKSKFTVQGDSIANQIELSYEYLKLHYPEAEYDKEILVYEDEGFSGKSFKRPKFQEFLREERKNPFDILICYRLDRISRNIADFSCLINEISKLETNFVSIKEEFDTKTPMGRAMMYIASVFAQLEREVITERIKDNMLELSKTGIWLGGITPTGFDTEKYKKIQMCEQNSEFLIERKNKKVCKLIVNENEKNIIVMIFKKYLEFKSLKKLESYLIQNEIKSRNGRYFSITTLRKILTNPVYVKNDKDILNYFGSKGIHIFYENDGREKFDGKYGLIAYNKTSSGKNIPTKYWIIAVGLHPGFIDGTEYINVQTILEKNIDKKYRAIKQDKNTLVVGLLKCKYCNSYMRPKNSGTLKKDKTYSYYYLCTLKEKSRGKKCKCTNIKGLEIDKKIAELLKNIFVPNVEIYYELKNMKLKKILNSEYNEIKILENEYRKNKKEISNIIDKLKYIDNDLTELVNKNLRKIRNDNEKIMNKINKIKNNNLLKKVDNVENKNALYIINNYFNSFNLLDLKTKRDILSIFIKNIYVSYDGKKNVEVNLLDEVIDQKKKDFFIFNSNFFYKKMSPDNNSRCT